MTEQEKQQARDNAKTYAELQGVEYVDPFPETAPEHKPDEEEELSNDKLLELLNKRAGITLSSIDDLKPKPTEEELEAIKQKRQNDMMQYGLSTGKFNKEDYDSYQRVSANKIQIIKDEIVSKLKEANPELSADAIEEKAASYMFSHLEETDPLRQQREAELAELADARLQKKYKNILSLETDFEQHEQGLNNKTNFERKVQATLPVYKKDVQTAIASLASREIVIPDLQNPANNIPVNIKFSEADLKEVENAFLEPDFVVKSVKEGYTPDVIKEMAEQVLLKKHLGRLISQAAKDYNSIQKDKYIKGLKGLIPENNKLDISDDTIIDKNKQVHEDLLKEAENTGLLK